MNYITLEAKRECYGLDQLHGTMTVRDLIEVLEEFAEDYGDDTPVAYSNDNGYTYGSINRCDIDVKSEDEEEDY